MISNPYPGLKVVVIRPCDETENHDFPVGTLVELLERHPDHSDMWWVQEWYTPRGGEPKRGLIRTQSLQSEIDNIASNI